MARTRVRDSHLLVKEPEPEPTPLRPGSPATASWLFRACQLNPDSARQVCSPGPITQDGDRNKNVEKERRITAVGKLQSCDRSEASDPASSSAPTPAPRPPRSAGSPGTEGGCSLSRLQTSPRPRGRARTHTHTHSHAAAATDTIGRRRTEGVGETWELRNHCGFGSRHRTWSGWPWLLGWCGDSLSRSLVC